MRLYAVSAISSAEMLHKRFLQTTLLKCCLLGPVYATELPATSMPSWRPCQRRDQFDHQRQLARLSHIKWRANSDVYNPALHQLQAIAQILAP